MADWQPIETAPRTGEPVHVRRVYQGRVIKEGTAVWGVLGEAAPSRSGMGLDPLGRLTAVDYRREAEAREEWVNSARWLKEDRMYAFPEPTEWLPA